MKTFLKRYGPAILSGMLLAFSFPGFHFFFLAWVALVPLLVSTRNSGPRECFGRFLLAGYVYHAILLQWLLTHFYWAGGLAFLGHQLLTLYLAFFWGCIGALWAWLRDRLPRAPAPVTLAVLWGAMEFVQDVLFSGFGWSSLGYSQGPDLAFLQLASVGGSILLSVVLVLFNGLMAESLRRRAKERLLPLAAAGAVLVLAHAAGWALLAKPAYGEPRYTVGVLQANFPQEIKWDPEFAVDMVWRAAEKSQSLAARVDVDLFVWPESLVTQPLETENLAILQALTRATGAALYTGATRLVEQGEGQYNSSVLLDDQGNLIDYYDKIHLAPFGEYIPFGAYLPFLHQVVPVEDLAHGKEPKVLSAGGRRFGPLICFEVLFRGMSQRLRRDGADFLVVITNLGWFGMSNALPQELEIARVRAVETRLPLVHSANTGISGVFDPWGRFEPLRGRIGAQGQYWEVEEPGARQAMIMRRGIQAFPVAKAAPQPFGRGPELFPVLALISAALLTLAGRILGRRPTP